MKEHSAEGILGCPERQPITEEHEETLWSKGILGEDSPDKLQSTILFLGWCPIYIARFEGTV